MPETPIDYHEMAKAQVNFSDNEADNLIQQIPPELRDHAAYQVPKRGAYGVTGEARLQAATNALRRATEHTEREARSEADKVARAQFQKLESEKREARKALGMMPYGAEPLPENWRECIARIEAGTKVGVIQQELANEKIKARDAETAAGETGHRFL